MVQQQKAIGYFKAIALSEDILISLTYDGAGPASSPAVGALRVRLSRSWLVLANAVSSTACWGGNGAAWWLEKRSAHVSWMLSS